MTVRYGSITLDAKSLSLGLSPLRLIISKRVSTYNDGLRPRRVR